jgi:hypothetical protein
MPFVTLTDEEEKELWRLSGFYWKHGVSPARRAQ